MSAENPEIIPLTADTWTEIASDIKSGFVHITLKGAVVPYFQSYRKTEVPKLDPPDAELTPDDDDFEGAAIYYRITRIADQPVPVGGASISNPVGMDVYVYPWGGNGEIRLDRGD